MKIRIINPRPGCSKYTSESQARRYVSRREAVLIGHELTFLNSAEQIHMHNIEQQISVSERSRSDVYVKGVVWWDAFDPGGMHRPGEVRS